jgi:hypothetical protein
MIPVALGKGSLMQMDHTRFAELIKTLQLK